MLEEALAALGEFCKGRAIELGEQSERGFILALTQAYCKMEQLLREKQQQSEQLKATYLSNSSANRVKSLQILKLNKEVQCLIEEKESVLIRLAHLEGERSRMEEALNDREKQLSDKTAQLSEKQQQLNGCQAKLARLTLLLSQLQYENKSYRQSNQRLARNISQLEERNRQLTCENQETRTQLDRVHAALMQKEKEELARLQHGQEDSLLSGEQVLLVLQMNSELRAELKELRQTERVLTEEVACYSEQIARLQQLLAKIRLQHSKCEGRQRPEEGQQANRSYSSNSTIVLKSPFKTRLRQMLDLNQELVLQNTALKGQVRQLEEGLREMRQQLFRTQSQLVVSLQAVEEQGCVLNCQIAQIQMLRARENAVLSTAKAGLLKAIGATAQLGSGLPAK